MYAVLTKRKKVWSCTERLLDNRKGEEQGNDMVGETFLVFLVPDL